MASAVDAMQPEIVEPPVEKRGGRFGGQPATDFLREELPYPAGFLAGKAYARYRARGGTRRSPIADLYIGAHAAVCRYRLVTRDSSRYRTYFPTLTLIAPEV
ncbi:hypothetical protein JD77_04297 [Micromonospora olivasterospora]|uniref:PIN domain-containing protein n=2 Tax=Micromonospora olivasterospora TaxID=1880 RepID=A0A562IEN0_MICOL|nr:hypothetical protein JD77_04297 [Micromonospora olivasterospora]